ncbi:MAG TPA: hypothetical protein VEW42_04350 [Candidatus Eisenbacteria bacterium]|nr:hypothetical protein [Candidatus Eisenbacteria bacterium]
MKSRLRQTTEKKTKKQLFFSLAGIVIVLFLLIKFGIPALTNLSLLLSSNKGVSQEDISNAKILLLPPVMNESFSATNSASITVSGTASPKQTIQLYVNDSLVDTTTVKNDSTFSFSGVNLTQQQNTIKTKAKLQDKVSNFSDTWTVTYIQKAPSLSVDNPHDGDTLGSPIVVRGKTDPDVKVTVNDFWAITDSSGNYSYTLTLQNGDNHIVVIATDAAGNTTRQELTVKHSQ